MPRSPKPPGHEDRIHARETGRAGALEVGRLDVMDLNARACLEAGVSQRLIQRDVGIADLDVLADHRDVDRRIVLLAGRDDLLPLAEVRRRRVDPELVADDRVELLLVQQDRNPVDVVGVDRGDHRALLDVGEERDLAPLLFRQRIAAAAQEHVRLDADATQLLDRMLGGLGLDFARTADDRNQGQVDVDAIAAAELDAHLTDGLEERQRFDVADRAADLDHADVGVAGAEHDAAADLVRDVRNHLHRRAEVVAAPLARDHALVDPPGREVAVAAGRGADEALVMPEVQVGLRPVLGDENLAVLERAHRARVHIDIGVELDHADLEPAGLENRSQAGRCEAFPQGGNHATGNEHESRHLGPRRRCETTGVQSS